MKGDPEKEVPLFWLLCAEQVKRWARVSHSRGAGQRRGWPDWSGGPRVGEK